MKKVHESPKLESEEVIDDNVETIKDGVKTTTRAVEKNVKIHYGDTGLSYEDLFVDYLFGAEKVTLQDPFIRQKHLISNLLKFAELLVKVGSCK